MRMDLTGHRLVTAAEVFMRRRYAEYRPSSRWCSRRPVRRATRTVVLSPAGWAAVMLLCLASVAVGYLVGGLADLSSWAGAVTGGAVAVLLILTALGSRSRARHDDSAR